ncbi:unnamed protein product [Dracunculus medinensis]|uniref:Calponin-homology (CH) domain-containing protein n=1 Tax=Dracunculus medinensis TaxID=318479 RepID=A0A0N4UHU6_DRAME|nr:unnamed protein product [Dracunculus medinensis]
MSFSSSTNLYSSDQSSSEYYFIQCYENDSLEHYEINLERYKDERDAIQKKTFTKWVNKHLSKTGRRVEDLFVDLSDGLNLIALLEVLSNEHLPHENGFTRFHRIQNVQYCLDFLKAKNVCQVKTVNIRPEDIVEGNSKLTLGLIWTIILNFQVSIIKQRQYEISNSQVKDLILYLFLFIFCYFHFTSLFVSFFLFSICHLLLLNFSSSSFFS